MVLTAYRQQSPLAGGGNHEVKIAEPQTMTPKRTEHGKTVRKAYENGVHKESRHTMTELEPRTDGICGTLTTVLKDNYVAEPLIGAVRGRNPDNPTSRESGLPTQQMLEIKEDGTSNTLTTVQKDNMVVEPNKYVRYTEDGFRLARTDEKHSSIQGTHVTYQDGTVHCMGTSHVPMTLEPPFRIRKLTPLECWRLMGFADDDFHKAEQVNSNSQLYKQAGNSIVVDVLMAIFKEML